LIAYEQRFAACVVHGAYLTYTNRFYTFSFPEPLQTQLQQADDATIKAIVQKDYLLFSAEEGAEKHCQVGALALFHERLFAWLDCTLAT
jgi:hypothetical protein